MLKSLCRAVAAAALRSSTSRFHTGAQVAKAGSRRSAPGVPAKGSAASNRPHTRGRIEDVERSMRQSQYVLDNFEIPGKYTKYLTGKMRKRELARWERKLSTPGDGELVQVGARSVIVDEGVQRRKADGLRGQIKRILETHLASSQLPVRLLSLQHWEITEYDVRKAIRESTAYLGAVVNRELARGAGRAIGAPRVVRVRFVNGAVTPDLAEAMQAEIQARHGPDGAAPMAGPEGEPAAGPSG
ncbi:hypothetical protein LPJ61_002925 [Coemansia biformis]|uniref:Uncharacterized protein n=1 Tax=Coemansia biformis TaxID=1286918 RepID=A0A9W7YDI9_9FUNG|nr:hypothetical protein LPJ61_002925 [Coemansia biformis]